MNDDPTFAPVSRSLDNLVSKLVQTFLSAYADEAKEALAYIDDEGGRFENLSLTTLSAPGIQTYLNTALTPKLGRDSYTDAKIAVLVSKEYMAVLDAQLDLDMAIYSVVRGEGSISPNTLFVNDPAIMDVLEEYNLPEGEVLLVPIRDYYTLPQYEGDARRDALIGVMPWRGVYLCRVALVALDNIQAALEASDLYGDMVKEQNSPYIPRYGSH